MKRYALMATFAAIIFCANAGAQTPQFPTPQQIPLPQTPPANTQTTPIRPQLPSRVVDLPTQVGADVLRRAFPAMRGLGAPIIVSMRTPNVGNVYLSATYATFSAGPRNSRPGASADGELVLQREMGAGLSVHIRSPGIAYAIEFEGDAGEWSLEYELRQVDSAGQLIGSSGPTGNASLIGLNRWLISVPAVTDRGVSETLVSIRAPWDHNGVPRERLRFRRLTVTPVNQ